MSLVFSGLILGHVSDGLAVPLACHCKIIDYANKLRKIGGMPQVILTQHKHDDLGGDDAQEDADWVDSRICH